MTDPDERDSFAIDVAAAYTPSERISPARIVIEGSRIAAIGPPDQVGVAPDMPRIEAGDLIATPGFIDTHIHGSSGVDVMEATWDALNTVSGALASHGTTSFLPTTVSASTEVLGESIRRLAGLQEGGFVGANPIGIHLEGPFISPIRRGTHPGEHIRDADAALLEEWIDMSDGAVRLLTIAPEVEGIDAVIKVAQARGVTVAMGHSDATLGNRARSGRFRGLLRRPHVQRDARAASPGSGYRRRRAGRRSGSGRNHRRWGTCRSRTRPRLCAIQGTRTCPAGD